jgi:hypothetical protein
MSDHYDVIVLGDGIEDRRNELRATGATFDIDGGQQLA